MKIDIQSFLSSSNLLKTKPFGSLNTVLKTDLYNYIKSGSRTSASLKNHKNSNISPKDMKLTSNENRHLELSNDTKFVKNGDCLYP